MRVLFVIGISLLQFVFISEARFISKKRDDGLEDSVDFTKEKSDRSTDINKFYKTNIRVPRSSKEQTGIPKNVTKINLIAKPKATLVKKPLSKFVDSEEDYQAKSKVQNKFSDSVEHEDEDFNLDDYDFDVNHDEFSSGGKPLEPRKKNKVVKPKEQLEPAPAKLESQLKPAVSQSKVIIPRNVDKVSYKVTRKAVDKMKEDEYDDEFSTSTISPSTNPTTSDEDASDESEDSKEFIPRVGVRTARSPLSFGTYVDKWGEKTSVLMNKILTYLPLFPQANVPKRIDEDAIKANSPMIHHRNANFIM